MLENELKPPEHLMIMRLSAIGDVAMIVPVVLALCQQYPKLKITVVSRPLFKPFFSSLPNVNFHAATIEGSSSGLKGIYRLYKELSNLDPDAFADLHNVLRSKMIATFFKRKSVRVVSLNKDRAARKKLTFLGPKKISPMTSMIDRHAEVCKQLHLPISLEKVELFGKKKLSSQIEQITGKKKSIWLGIAPFATYTTKMYPLELMKKLINLLLEKDIRLFLFGGGKKEIEVLETIASISSKCINIAGNLSFEQELDLISNLDLMLSMDSGNGHMAAMFDIPVITLWGNTHPYAGFVPFRQPIENSLLPDLKKYPFLPTSVYGNKIVDGYEDCMKTIRPESIFVKIDQLLALSKPNE